jgi:hypothetical protein
MKITEMYTFLLKESLEKGLKSILKIFKYKNFKYDVNLRK